MVHRFTYLLQLRPQRLVHFLGFRHGPTQRRSPTRQHRRRRPHRLRPQPRRDPSSLRPDILLRHRPHLPLRRPHRLASILHSSLRPLDLHLNTRQRRVPIPGGTGGAQALAAGGEVHQLLLVVGQRVRGAGYGTPAPGAVPGGGDQGRPGAAGRGRRDADHSSGCSGHVRGCFLLLFIQLVLHHPQAHELPRTQGTQCCQLFLRESHRGLPLAQDLRRPSPGVVAAPLELLQGELTGGLSLAHTAVGKVVLDREGLGGIPDSLQHRSTPARWGVV
mmetsp:Transcript_12786/g.31826  ORF Transcript_12786/g.31826 Transcript_12786/m.31826 type:complete len:275 (-) Transcript_12786:1310-2134(-)